MLEKNGSVWGNWSVEAPAPDMEGMMNVWAMVEHMRVASGAVELAIFTAILYWFFTSSRVADMLELVGERVGGWCGRDASAPTTLRQAVRRRRHNDLHARVDSERATRASSLYRVKESASVPTPQPPHRPAAGLACARCAPISRDSWQDKRVTDNGGVINILDIGRQTFANGGVVSRYLCDLAQCCHLTTYDYKDVVPEVVKDEHFQRAIEDTTAQEMKSSLNGSGDSEVNARYGSVRKRVEARAMKVLMDISSAMSNNVLRLVAWLCHKAIRRVAGGGCGTRAECVERLRRAKAAGLPLVFVPLHRSHFDYILVTFTLYLTGLRPPLVAAGDNMRIPFFGWFLRGCGAFYIRRGAYGANSHNDPIYKSALRAYILNSLAAKNNIEFFIEGGRTRTGKPQLPKAGILSVITDAYLDGTIDDALLVPVTVNYDRLVDGNFVREQLGRPKQMETFWSALRGIWHTLNTNHGGIRVDFNQPISLKELITSFKKHNYVQAPLEPHISLNNNLADSIDRQILYNHSHSSMYGDSVSVEHKMMVEAIGRHLVYDAAQSTALMSTNVMSYVLLTSCRGGATPRELAAAVCAATEQLRAAGRDAPVFNTAKINHALDMLGKSLVRRVGTGESAIIQPVLSVASALELSYYANSVVAHYAADAIVATALESVIQSNKGSDTVRLSVLRDAAIRLVAALPLEFVLCPPCRTSVDMLSDALHRLVPHILKDTQAVNGLEEQQWSRRFAQSLDEEEDEYMVQERDVVYKIVDTPEALQERRRLLLTLRPLLEAYSATCGRLVSGTEGVKGEKGAGTHSCSLKVLVADTLDLLTQKHAANLMPYGEAVSSDAIQNCIRLLKQWGVLTIQTEGRDRKISFCPPYDNPANLAEICQVIHSFNMPTPLLSDVK